ncbi:MAG: asparagine synthase (glutamine-hydrolyzing) [Candidatus Korobacteraceae bacterium]
MCGICGTANWGGNADLERMNATQRHRGPDDCGAWQHLAPDGSRFALGSSRLSIIDLSLAGHMPMSNEDGTVWITYNGEIYNACELRPDLEARGHRFRSHTDTEVIVHLYEEEGVDCLKKLNGMFAFCICDLRGRVPHLFLARDHFGIKPLYYVHRGRRFAFASEAKALLQLPGMGAAVEPEALHQYLTFLWVPGPETMFREVFKLPPGHYALFGNGELKISEYWDLKLPARGSALDLPERELIQELRERFFDSVKRQMVSDVPIGAFLSGGIDSTGIVSAMAGACSHPVRTYMITFPPKDRTGFKTLDNPQVARHTAARMGCEHHEIVVEPDVVSLLPKLIWHMDEPTADPAIVAAYLVCREARKSTTVLLSGVGGDELFAGYRKHVAYYWAQYYRVLPSALRHGVIEPLIEHLPVSRGHLRDAVRLAKKMARSASLKPRDAFLMDCTYLDGLQKASLYTSEMRQNLADSDPLRYHHRHFDRVQNADFLDQMLYSDIKTFMVSLNLNYADKMSMASSVEVRVPFLDWQFAEWVFANIPPRLRLHGRIFPSTKYIFRKALKDELGEEVLRQPKAGFGAPVDEWLLGELREMVDDLLSESRIRRAGYFDPKIVGQMVQEHRDGKHNWSMQIWQLLTIELWMQVFLEQGYPLEARPVQATP